MSGRLKRQEKEERERHSGFPHVIALEVSSSQTGRAVQGQGFQGALCEWGQLPSQRQHSLSPGLICKSNCPA